jgi:hypothetical protein
LLTSQASLFIVVVVAVDSNSGLRRHGVVFVEAGVIGVCCGDCVWLNDGCRWWLLEATMMLLMMVVENGCCVSINKVTHY